ncbi:MAG: AgmX/PglI C-terminal domain-containing protein [Pseudomonadales bacterium]|nr:AgmX/PglI C-terminal domain-containing protein [Pseudomonadales bacterium]
MTTSTYINDDSLPWSSTNGGDPQFHKILAGLVAFLLVISLAVPFLTVPEIKREQAEKLPEHLARVIIKRKKIAPPPPKVVAKKPEKKPEEKDKLKPKKEPEKKVAKVKKPTVKQKPKQTVSQAKKKAAAAGLLAFQDDLMAMRQQVKPTQLSNQRLNNSGAKAEKKSRNLIGAKQLKGSGGIRTADLSGATGNNTLSAHQSTAVFSSIESTESTHLADNNEGSASASKSRSIEEVRKIFDRNKGAIYALYNRAIRKDPGLQGKVVLELVIEPSGIVSACQIVSSELNHSKLERKLITRVKMFSFGEKDVSVTRVNYPIDFLPS